MRDSLPFILSLSLLLASSTTPHGSFSEGCRAYQAPDISAIHSTTAFLSLATPSGGSNNSGTGNQGVIAGQTTLYLVGDASYSVKPGSQ